MSQMRVAAGSDYVGHVRRILGATSSPGPEEPLPSESLGDY
jgi:hypothetical protein